MNYITNKEYLLTISKIKEDEIYIQWLNRANENCIDFANSSELNSTIALDHGMRHSLIVAENTAKLLYQYGGDERTIFYGYVAGLLHDIGMVDGKKGHAKNSYILAKKYLKKYEIFDDKDTEMILDAIVYHGGGENITSQIVAFISIADKVEYVKDRRIKSKYNSASPIDEIVSNSVDFKNGELLIHYTVTSNFSNDAFYIIPKSIDIPFKIGEKMGFNVKFYINGKIEKFLDRSSYQGYVYS